MSKKLFCTFFSGLAAKIADEHDLTETDVLSTIESYCGSCAIVSKGLKEKESPKTKEKKSPKKDSSKSKIGLDGICEGTNVTKGERCTFKAKQEHEGKMYCAKHYTLATKEKKPTKTTKSNTKKNSDEKTSKMVEKLVIDKATTTTRKNKWGNYQTDDGIVFDKTSKKAVGNQLDNGKIGPLTTEQISICEANNWRFEKPEKEKIPDPPKKKKSKKVESESESDLELELESDDEEE